MEHRRGRKHPPRPGGAFRAALHGLAVARRPAAAFLLSLLWINVIAWGLAYLIAALRPATRSTVLTAGGIGKFAYFLACLSPFDAGAGKAALLAAALADLLFAALFAAALMQPRTFPTLATSTKG